MRHAPALLAALLVAAAGPVAQAGAPAAAEKPAAAENKPKPPSSFAPLRGSDCLDPSQARTWHYADPDVLLVDAGRRKYRIQLTDFCHSLGTAADLRFVGDPISGRVCGNLGDHLQLRGERCRIQRVELLDEAAYREAAGLDRKKGEAKARAGAGT